MPEVKYNDGYNNDHNKRHVDFNEIAQLVFASQDMRIRKDVNKSKAIDKEICDLCSTYLHESLSDFNGMINDAKMRKRVKDAIDLFFHQLIQIMPCVKINDNDGYKLIDMSDMDFNYDVVVGDGQEVRDKITERVYREMVGYDSQSIMMEIENRMKERSGSEIVIMPKDTNTLLVFQKFGLK